MKCLKLEFQVHCALFLMMHTGTLGKEQTQAQCVLCSCVLKEIYFLSVGYAEVWFPQQEEETHQILMIANLPRNQNQHYYACL
mmetsp:Transcript_33578/g.54801  ORF Transcript_33578/g.54801 Transcript_33578/m.54801 type:complete len:83 (-) Transcript_33578:81-329(-)